MLDRFLYALSHAPGPQLSFAQDRREKRRESCARAQMMTAGSVFSPLLTKVSGFSLANVLICVYINLLANENRLKNNQNVPSGPRIVSYLTRVRANTALSKLRGF